MQSSSKKIALVTGANKGIGFEIARQLGKAGSRVVLGARNPASGEAAAATLQGRRHRRSLHPPRRQ
jgi:NAD(P)-dependent dehydrogenase (short-subunit alcohol dehydrogenase family)